MRSFLTRTSTCQDLPVQTGSDHAARSVSVVIAAWTFERLDAIGDAIASVRAQTVPAHEIILVVDHSEPLLAESRSRWPDITVIPNGEARGTSGARNTGVAKSTGDVVAFVDDDAVAAPDWLERMTAAYSDEQVLGVGGTIRPRWVEGRPWWFPDEFDWVVGCTHSGMPQQRSRVRNLVGANMSFRRHVLIDVGGMRPELTRLGTVPVGPEDTDLCIRIGQMWPDGVILYDPAIEVDHTVPRARSRISYFVTRCAAEGRSKAVLGRFVGTDSGLSDERAYVRRTLPLGVIRGVRKVFRGDPNAAARAAMIVVGLLITSVGYLVGFLRRPAENGLETGKVERADCVS
jgi:glycosyltransferase involved in cell wall biosynthesis